MVFSFVEFYITLLVRIYNHAYPSGLHTRHDCVLDSVIDNSGSKDYKVAKGTEKQGQDWAWLVPDLLSAPLTITVLLHTLSISDNSGGAGIRCSRGGGQRRENPPLPLQLVAGQHRNDVSVELSSHFNVNH